MFWNERFGSRVSLRLQRFPRRFVSLDVLEHCQWRASSRILLRCQGTEGLSCKIGKPEFLERR